jgi:hypothetical protein
MDPDGVSREVKCGAWVCDHCALRVPASACNGAYDTGMQLCQYDPAITELVMELHKRNDQQMKVRVREEVFRRAREAAVMGLGTAVDQRRAFRGDCAVMGKHGGLKTQAKRRARERGDVLYQESWYWKDGMK